MKRLYLPILAVLFLAGCDGSGSGTLTLHNESRFVIDQFFVAQDSDLGYGMNWISTPLEPGQSAKAEKLRSGEYVLVLRYIHGSGSNRQFVYETLKSESGKDYHWWFYLGSTTQPPGSSFEEQPGFFGSIAADFVDALRSIGDELERFFDDLLWFL